MKDLLLFIAESLIGSSENIEVDVNETDRFIDCVIRVPEEHIGKLIGRNGKIATAIRTVARASARKSDKHVNVKIDKIA